MSLLIAIIAIIAVVALVFLGIVILVAMLIRRPPATRHDGSYPGSVGSGNSGSSDWGYASDDGDPRWSGFDADHGGGEAGGMDCGGGDGGGGD